MKVLRGFLFLFIMLACCCTDADAAEKGKVELGGAVLEVLYTGDPPLSLKEAVRRFFFFY